MIMAEFGGLAFPIYACSLISPSCLTAMEAQHARL